jgi:hypothetical protein
LFILPRPAVPPPLSSGARACPGIPVPRRSTWSSTLQVGSASRPPHAHTGIMMPPGVLGALAGSLEVHTGLRTTGRICPQARAPPFASASVRPGRVVALRVRVSFGVKLKFGPEVNRRRSGASLRSTGHVVNARYHTTHHRDTQTTTQHPLPRQNHASVYGTARP